MITPDFAAMPCELRGVHRWVVHRRKVPYCATAINSKASVTNPSSWSTFDQAQTAFEEGGFDGVGVVLNGDGIVGVDFDGCVSGGQPVPAAMALMDRIGAKYIEVSPSGAGLRAFGYGESIKGARGELDGVRVELYARDRYLTVTGHPISDGPLVQLAGFLEVAATLRPRTLQKSTEVFGSHPLSPLFSSVLLCKARLEFSGKHPSRSGG